MKVVGEEAGEVGISEARMSLICRGKEAEVQPPGKGNLQVLSS